MPSCIQRTPYLQWSMGVETSCFGAVFLPRDQDFWSVWGKEWMGPCIVRFWVKTSFDQQGHWRCVAGSFSMTMTPNTPPGQRRSGFVSPCCPAKVQKHHCSRGDLHGGMGQNTSSSVWKPCKDLQKTFDLCHCQQRACNKVLRWPFVIDQILIFHHNLQINC